MVMRRLCIVGRFLSSVAAVLDALHSSWRVVLNTITVSRLRWTRGCGTMKRWQRDASIRLRWTLLVQLLRVGSVDVRGIRVQSPQVLLHHLDLGLQGVVLRVRIASELGVSLESVQLDLQGVFSALASVNVLDCCR